MREKMEVIEVVSGVIMNHMKEGMENIRKDYMKEEIIGEMIRWIYISIISVIVI
jgi:succinate dehydrogenase hydrophobic anchor subunit